jgi:hypothetical protein
MNFKFLIAKILTAALLVSSCDALNEISGVVRDVQGTPVSEATVEFYFPDNYKPTYQTKVKTNESGVFEWTYMARSYDQEGYLIVSKPGYSKLVQPYVARSYASKKDNRADLTLVKE